MIDRSCFPFRELESVYRSRILSSGVPKEAVAQLLIWFCHISQYGKHNPWIGFRLAAEAAQIAEAIGKRKNPSLIFGMHTMETVTGCSEATLLTWPGATYLQYNVDDETLTNASLACIRHCAVSLPAKMKLRQTPKGLINLISHIRHDFEGAKTPIEIRKAAVHAAICGRSTELSPMRGVWIFSEKQENGITRLISYMELSQSIDPKQIGLKLFQKIQKKFRTQWRVLQGLVEMKSKSYASLKTEYLKWEQLEETCQRVIESLRYLEGALKESVGKHHD